MDQSITIFINNETLYSNGLFLRTG